MELHSTLVNLRVLHALNLPSEKTPEALHQAQNIMKMTTGWSTDIQSVWGLLKVVLSLYFLTRA